jgi:nucleoside-diphosphate-sugar epimerase
MRIFMSGATGVVGRRAVADLVAAGHEVTALVRSDDKAELIRGLGARPVKVSLFDREALQEGVSGSDVVINLATSIPSASRAISPKAWKENDRIRSEGSRNLVDAAIAAGASRYVEESVTFLYAGGGDRWLDEESPVEPTPITSSALDAEANARRLTEAGRTGIVLRFGAFYGPDSEHTVLLLKAAKAGFDPLPGEPGGYISSISTDDAAAAVLAALAAPAGIYNVVDDSPLTRAEYDDAIAKAVGVRKVRRLWMPSKGMEHIARSQRVSNSRFRSATGWVPRHPSFVEALPELVDATVGRRSSAERTTRMLLGALRRRPSS